MSIRLLAIDLDGTTVRDDGLVGEENRTAIRKAAQSGIVVVPVTGRTYYEMPEELLYETTITYSIYSNGACIRSGKEKMFYENLIPEKTAKNLLHLLLQYETMTEIYTGGHPVTDENKLNNNSYAYYKIDPVFQLVLDATRVGVPHYTDFCKTVKSVEMIHVFFRNQVERTACIEKLKAFSSEIEFTTSMDNNLEILKKGVNKGTGLTRLCSMLGIDKGEVMTLGDSKNDMSMFRLAGLPIAVGNACKELKLLAREVICTNNENAVAFAVNKYILNGANV